MTKEPQPTTHNAESGARSTCRERSETEFFFQRTLSRMCAARWLVKYLKDILVWRNGVEHIRRSRIIVGV